MSDHDVGQGQVYDKHAYRDLTFPGRPHGGFLEERVQKLEYELMNLTEALERVIGSPTGNNTVLTCHCCGDIIMPIAGMTVPICNDCRDAIHELKEKKKSWLLK